MLRTSNAPYIPASQQDTRRPDSALPGSRSAAYSGLRLQAGLGPSSRLPRRFPAE